MLDHIKLKLDSLGYAYQDEEGRDIICAKFVELRLGSTPKNLVVTLSKTKVTEKSVAIRLHGNDYVHGGEYLDKDSELNHVCKFVHLFLILYRGCALLMDLGYKHNDVIWVTLEEGGKDVGV